MIDPARARAIRLVGLDVDGTLTDGGIYLGAVTGAHAPAPLEFKKYDIRDGLGVLFLRNAGIKVVVVTGRESESVRLRAAELEVDDVGQDRHARKLALWNGMLSRHGVRDEDAAFIGDDLPDLSILRAVGLAVVVADAVPEVRAVADVVLTRRGGAGAVREFAELLLRARGEWDDLVSQYEASRAGAALGAGA
jgi:3-deoxy-D-manno-octulosonate 8-phosphate phosphatase (KDO 8-P phosphatase)